MPVHTDHGVVQGGRASPALSNVHGQALMTEILGGRRALRREGLLPDFELGVYFDPEGTVGAPGDMSVYRSVEDLLYADDWVILNANPVASIELLLTQYSQQLRTRGLSAAADKISYMIHVNGAGRKYDPERSRVKLGVSIPELGWIRCVKKEKHLGVIRTVNDEICQQITARIKRAETLYARLAPVVFRSRVCRWEFKRDAFKGFVIALLVDGLHVVVLSRAQMTRVENAQSRLIAKLTYGHRARVAEDGDNISASRLRVWWGFPTVLSTLRRMRLLFLHSIFVRQPDCSLAHALLVGKLSFETVPLATRWQELIKEDLLLLPSCDGLVLPSRDWAWDAYWKDWGRVLRETRACTWKRLISCVLSFDAEAVVPSVVGPETGRGMIFSCKICLETFDGLRRLRKHESSTHKSNDAAIFLALRKHYCVFCGSVFGNAGSARNHLQKACRDVYIAWKSCPEGTPFMLVRPRVSKPNKAHGLVLPDDVATVTAAQKQCCVFCGCLFPYVGSTALKHLRGHNQCKVAYEWWKVNDKAPYPLCRPLRCVRARSERLVAMLQLNKRRIEAAKSRGPFQFSRA